MARALPGKRERQTAAHPRAAAPPDDLEILAPDITLTLAGEEVTARELRFGEQLKYWRELSDVTAELARAAQDDNPDAILEAFVTCHDSFMTLLCVATGKPPAFVEDLRGAQAEALLGAFWSANQGFFLRRLVAEFRKAAEKTAGEKSSPPSSATATPEVS
jgi:hypothetical protein